MIALKKLTKYPFDNSQLRWVSVEPCVWSRATIFPEDSYIFVDKDIKQYLDDKNIVLEWSRFRKHIQTPNIQSINGVELPKLRKRSKQPIKTLAEIITGTRGKHRVSHNTFHANDWTRNAFDKNAKKHTTDNYVAAAIASVIEHELIIPQGTELFNLPTVNKRFPEAANDDIKWDDIWGDSIPTENVELPIVRYDIDGDNVTRTIDDVVTNFESKINVIMPPPPTPWYKNVPLLSFTALLLLLSLSVWMS